MNLDHLCYSAEYGRQMMTLAREVRSANIGEPERFIDIPDPVEAPEEMPLAQPVEEPAQQPEPVPA